MNGVNVAAILAVAAGVGVYYALPQAWLKVVWGLGVSALAYLALVRAGRTARGRYTPAATVASSQRSSSPS